MPTACSNIGNFGSSRHARRLASIAERLIISTAIAPADQPSSAGQWLDQAIRAIDAIKAQERVPIVVGGTGLYLQALLQGIAPIPDVPGEVRQEASQRFDELGVPGFHQDLAKRDPEQAALLKPGDRQRLIRAAEVLEATGKSLLYWKGQPQKTRDAAGADRRLRPDAASAGTACAHRAADFSAWSKPVPWMNSRLFAS